ncbi:tRNA (adenine(57)-N(1)/adenine(58)-N(1))-methyltransferase TrmI [Candidatus Tiddalikarchaeum anstoanum]|nr:tRNA (adenine(57)-N(1)/adenine(58)-N(1))-methyltransferase TrmI [Candidatus Tiddalikarchaeum anstoanum]
MKLIINTEWQKIFPDTVSSDIHSTYGVIKKEDINTKKNRIITTHNNNPLIIAEPNFRDLFKSIKRGPQIITLKDASIIASEMGLMQGYRVVDSGGGSGALTCFLANIVGPKGKVYSYEIEKKWCSIIEENVKLFGFANVEIINKDVFLGVSEKDVDAVNLDVPNPWEAVKIVEKILKNSGVLTVYVPNTTQLTIMSEKAKGSTLNLVRVIETIEREWVVNERICHPKFDMLGHTGFIMVFRKIDLGGA